MSDAPTTELITRHEYAAPPVHIAPESPEWLLARAIERGVDVATIERLVALRSQFKAEAAREAYFRDLAAFQAESAVVTKTKSVSGSVRYSYAPLDQIVAQIGEALARHGFSFDFDVATQDNKLIATCNSHHRAGHTECRTFTVPLDFGGKMNAVQQYGAASTYARRYALLNTYGLVTTDDDDAQSCGTPPAPAIPDYMKAATPTAATAATVAPTPAPIVTPATTPPAPTDPLAPRELLQQAATLKTQLAIDDAGWAMLLAPHGVTTLRQASEPTVRTILETLQYLDWTRRLRNYLEYPADRWAAALQRRGKTHELQLSLDELKTIYEKLAQDETPFKLAELKIGPANASVTLGNAPSPAATPTPPAAEIPSPPTMTTVPSPMPQAA